jgi:hypothetical protein
MLLFFLATRLLFGTSCTVDEPDYANADRYYTAVAKVPEFFTPNPCSETSSPVDVFAAPGSSRKIAEIRWWKSGDAQACYPLVIETGAACPRDLIPLLEDGYEERVFVAVEHTGRWARIRLDAGKSTGWIHLSKSDEIIPYDDLVIGRMAELTSAWDGRIHPRPGGPARKLDPKSVRGVTALDSRRLDGKLWLQVRLLAENPCEVHEPRILTTGWIRAYSAKKQPTVSHFSRGC